MTAVNDSIFYSNNRGSKKGCFKYKWHLYIFRHSGEGPQASRETILSLNDPLDHESGVVYEIWANKKLERVQQLKQKHSVEATLCSEV